MEHKIIYEYCLLRFVADVEREEFLNVGLLMMSKRRRWMRCRVKVNPDKINALFRNADTERLITQLSVFCREDIPDADLPVEERYRWMAAVKSAVIQTSPSHPGIIPLEKDISRAEATELLEEKFQQLFSRLVE